jgi:hypothetical protein
MIIIVSERGPFIFIEIVYFLFAVPAISDTVAAS